VLKSKSYDFPVICVGNLSVGGTGKTPMIEYLIRLLKNEYQLATLSRGYKRQTDGFLIGNQDLTATDLGDEPFQFFNKFKDIIVSVDGDRQNGIAKLRDQLSRPEVVLLDDAFQHRRIKAGLNILLTSYGSLYSDDICLPTGNLREPRSGANRAHVVVVTKCPKDLQDAEKETIQRKLRLNENQVLFFSSIEYEGTIYSESKTEELTYLKNRSFTLITGIANPDPLVEFFISQNFDFEHLSFKDHHEFSESEVENFSTKSLILTTEKDYMRLRGRIDEDKLFYLPIIMRIDRTEAFNNLINEFVKSF
jgi:tetraacyldisaccharide 4'-kinase